jgi:hypothetical protein
VAAGRHPGDAAPSQVVAPSSWEVAQAVAQAIREQAGTMQELLGPTLRELEYWRGRAETLETENQLLRSG